MYSKSRKINRRDFLKLSGIGLAGIFFGSAIAPWIKRVQQPTTNVTILREDSYQNNLEDSLRRGISQYPNILNKIQGGRVVLKPNLVDHYPNRPLNTHPAMLAATIAAFRKLGAQEVIVAEGPGHNRDTEMIVEQSGVSQILKDERVRFVDLNLDDCTPIELVSRYTQLSRIFFPHTILGADLVVSMPKLKTHHWAGVTLSLKNLFGIIPGIKYGWPKNFLHWHGISQSIADIATTIAPGFAIVDGIVGMEGDGPLHGSGVDSNVVIMGDNLTAVDATAVRLMGFYPERIQHLLLMMPYGGTINEMRIKQIGESLASSQILFQPPPVVMTNINQAPSFWHKALVSGW